VWSIKTPVLYEKSIFKYFRKDICYLAFRESKEIGVDDIEKIEISLKLSEIKLIFNRFYGIMITTNILQKLR